jgi:4-carboxymuconolactone decarboxylase
MAGRLRTGKTMDHAAVATVVATLLSVTPALAQQRLPTIPPAQYDEDQKKAAEEFEAARKAPVFGPFEPMMHSPQVMSLARATGDYLRYHSAIGNTLSELVILVTARVWSQDFEWSVHHPVALKAGISKEIADAIGDGRRPTGMSADEEIVYDFATELHQTRRVSDPTYARAEQRFGSKGVVDITALCGYYSLLAMQLNVARYPVADGAPKLSRFPN